MISTALVHVLFVLAFTIELALIPIVAREGHTRHARTSHLH